MAKNIVQTLNQYNIDCDPGVMHVAINALSNDILLGERFMEFPQRIMDEISNVHYGDNLFLHCTPLELSSWCEDDKIFISNPRIAHSIRMLEKNIQDDFFGINMSTHDSIEKIGPLRIVHGKINNFCGLIRGVVCSPKLEDKASYIRKKYGLSWSIDTCMPFKKTSHEKSQFKTSGILPPALGSKVRARPSNGMPGGKIGVVESFKNGIMTVNFEGKRMQYNIEDPRTMYILDMDLT